MRVVPISQFATIGFCKRQLYINTVMRIKLKQKAMLQGQQHHNRFSKIKVPEAQSFEGRCLRFPYESLLTTFIYKGYMLVGKPDWVSKYGDILVVEEEKFVTTPRGIMRDSWELQLLAYCHGLKNGKTVFEYGDMRREISFPESELYYSAIERHQSTGEIAYIHKPRKFKFSLLERWLDEFVNVVNGDNPPEVQESAKCKSCAYRKICYL